MGCNSSKNAADMIRFEEAQADDTDDDEGTTPKASDSKRGRKGLNGEDGHQKLESNLAIDPFSLLDMFPSANKPTVSVPTTLTVIVTENIFDDSPSTNDAQLFIVNKEKVAIFFKMKVTHPTILACKPNAGRIDPSGTVIVSVRLIRGQDHGAAHKLPKNVKAMVQTVISNYSEDDRLPYHAWQFVDKNIVRQDVVKIEFKDPEPEEDEELDFSKFKSVTMSVERSEKAWWK